MDEKVEFLSLEKRVPYRYGKLSSIAYEAQGILKAKNRTDVQLQNVLNLIFDLIQVYFEEEKDLAINKLREEILGRVYYSEQEVSIDDVYPFQWEYLDKYTHHLEFIGDSNDLDCPSAENTDDVDALYEILDWLKENENEDGFLDAEPREYYAALALHYISFVIERYESFEGSISLTSLDSTIIACNALSIGNIIHETGKYKKITNDIQAENNELKIKENRKKKALAKATNSKHKRNREAKRIVCDEWLKNKSNHKSAAAAAKFYKVWLDERGYSYEITTIRLWILTHAKENNVKW
ncbi:hypothetical protein I2494_03935 [Budviciaceae bacterium BWR-B9]|uniref:Uncharacterized protein n=1 Tax=Limnobaculum allomyrinae TaxID=2791986 RepID=A0ABS1IMA3_9GAMM|nr:MULTISPECIES: hypothetical protein [Limnobaculum]MBK5142874.1 hypothetical protein [Limnobaculum allomyrinae]MBV7690239.1 hypothetical protein [Limnobaculum sp. M2-1]